MRFVTRSEWATVVGLTALILLAASLPYLLAYAVPADHVFAGILFNPLDGNSYFSKMRAGARGDWLFTLPYTAEPGAGVFIFTYYLLLGHLARWTGAGPDLIYHLARVLAGAFLLLTAYRFLARFFETRRARLGAWLLFALGSGLGWLAVPFGQFTSDLWVAEAIPFLALFSNSHFCLALALMLWVLDLAESPRWKRLAGLALATTLLAQVQPMALIVPGAVLGGLALFETWKARALILARWLPVFVFAVFAAPWLLYDFSITFTQPQLAGWNAQNLTPSPPLWDALLTGGAPLLLALLGGWVAARRRAPGEWLALVWFGVNVILLYFPWALQRRLSLGIWMPLTILAGIGWRDMVWPRLASRWRLLALTGAALLIIPSNLLVYAATLSAIPRRAPEVFWTRAEKEALDFLAANAAGKVVLAPPAFSLFIPARTDARVVYGHPFETVNAATQKQAVLDFFAGQADPDEFLQRERVAYIVYSRCEENVCALPPSQWRLVFREGETKIYAP